MKFRTLKTFALVGFLFMLAAASVHAQSRNTIEANIPFDFAVGDTILKAGQYMVDRVDMQRLVVTSTDGKVRVFALAPRNVERTRNDAWERLVFHHYADTYFLSEAWINGSGNGLYPSKAERRVGNELAKTNGKPERTEILARRK